VRARRSDLELVRERGTRLDRILGDVRDAVHRIWHALAVEVNAGRLVQVVPEDRPDPVALHHLDPWRRPCPVVAERRDRVRYGVDPVQDLVDRQLEDLDAVLDPGRRQRLVPCTLERRAFAVEESLHDREGGCVVVHRRGGRRGRSRRRGRLMARVIVRARRRSRWERRCRRRVGGRYVHDGWTDAGAQAATAAANKPPPVSAPARKSDRRVSTVDDVGWSPSRASGFAMSIMRERSRAWRRSGRADWPEDRCRTSQIRQPCLAIAGRTTCPGHVARNREPARAIWLSPVRLRCGSWTRRAVVRRGWPPA
jgi:hypothetical protein